ncbi:hypothetical protein [Nocardia sp. NPDC056000]|uniref:hypothetical protein n=1 Tax=Nocardia sp. NPDC056000 TaxID=3345674 RepID=UPI0035D9F1F4
MVTSQHEVMHRIFQEDPGVFARAFRVLGLPIPDPVAVALLSTDLTEHKPLERRPDTVLQIDTAADGSYLLVVESQGRRSDEKPYAWTYYLAYLQSKYSLPCVLLVVCQDGETAAWADRNFIMGPRIWAALILRPMVLGPHNVPIVTDLAIATRDIPLAMFSAVTHARNPQVDGILAVLAAALKTIDGVTASVFAELTELGLGASPAGDIWRQLMAVDLSFFRSETSQRLRNEGRDEGRIEELRKAVLGVLVKRGLDVPAEIRAQVLASADLAALQTWFDRAFEVSKAGDIFAE